VTLDEAREHIGDKVVYCPPGPSSAPRPQRREEGVITSVSASWVFVRYGADYGSKATDPRDVSLLTKEG
jgi:hypothetical protein